MKKIKKLLLTVILLSALIISQTGCGSEGPVSKTSYYLDTICQIDIYSMEEEEAGRIIQGAFSLCSDYEKLLSKTVEESDIWKINHSGGAPVTVSPETAEVIEKGIYYGDISGGRFDITIGKVSDLWDFHSENPEVPSKEKLSEAVSHVDYTKIKVEGTEVTLLDPETEIDLGGIAKGYICDRVCDYLREEGVESGVVNLGGNIAVIGSKNGREPFRVGIERPYSDRSEIVGYIEGEDVTLVTSGIYERCFEKDGRTYHHILDTGTGYPVESGVESVTIIAKAGMSVDCDALSTMCLALGVEEVMSIVDSIDGVEAVFIDSDDNISATEGAGFIKQ